MKLQEGNLIKKKKKKMFFFGYSWINKAQCWPQVGTINQSDSKQPAKWSSSKSVRLETANLWG